MKLLLYKWPWSIACHQRKHEWSEVPGHIRGEFDLISQEPEPGQEIDISTRHQTCSQINTRLVSKKGACRGEIGAQLGIR